MRVRGAPAVPGRTGRQVRRMFSAIGHEVVALKRVGFATIKLHDLPRGQWRRLTDVEVRKLKEL